MTISEHIKTHEAAKTWDELAEKIKMAKMNAAQQNTITITREQAEALRVAAEIAYGFYKTIFSMSPEKETPSSAEYKQYITIADARVALLEALHPEG